MLICFQCQLACPYTKVIEANHTVILGWNSKVCGMVRQFSLANESEGGGCVVILADDDKEAIEERVIEVLGSLNLDGTRVIIRGGKPFLISDLLKISAHKAKAIIVTSPDDDYVDAFSLQAVLALKALEVKHTAGRRGGLIAFLSPCHTHLSTTFSSALNLSEALSFSRRCVFAAAPPPPLKLLHDYTHQSTTFSVYSAQFKPSRCGGAMASGAFAAGRARGGGGQLRVGVGPGG